MYLVCDSQPAAGALADVLQRAIRGGVEVVQLRDKALHGDALREAASAVREVCHARGALFIVNDHPQVAVDVGADGVHVGQHDMDPTDVRAVAGPDMLIGLSTHSRADIDAAVSGAPRVADYLGVGPVFETPTKPGRPAVGVSLVKYAAAVSPLPFFAIGGIDVSNLAAVAGAGARGVAVVRAIAGADNPEAAAQALAGALKDYERGSTGYTATAA